MSAYDRPPLRAPRDTGLSLRSATRMDRRRETQDAWQTPLLVVVALILIAGITISALSTPRPVAKATPTEAPAAEAPKGPDIIPTPTFAQVRTIQLHLPVPTDALTAMEFHQATYTRAQPMVSLIGEVGIGAANRAAKATRAALKWNRDATGSVPATTVPPLATAPATATMTPEGVWTGRAVRVWRQGRPGKPDTAADVGARPGTTVLSPVDGKITLVKEYMLYGKWPDYEIHISVPTWPDLDVVVLHVTDPRVYAGQPVIGGVTPIASVRKLSNLTSMQLRTITTDGGDHTHVQVNKVETGAYVPPDDLEHVLE